METFTDLPMNRTEGPVRSACNDPVQRPVQRSVQVNSISKYSCEVADEAHSVLVGPAFSVPQVPPQLWETTCDEPAGYCNDLVGSAVPKKEALQKTGA